MAKIKLGVTVVGIRGTLGGSTFSANKSGPYVRAWSKGSNPRTPLQTDQRTALSTIPELWNALTPPVQAGWDTFALLPAQDRTDSLGQVFSASGYNWFTICNVRLLNIGRSPITTVPVIARPAAPTISSLQLPFLDGQIAKVTYPSGEFSASQDQVIEIGVVSSIGRTVAPAYKPLLLLDKDPPDTDQVFRIPYLERWNLIGKGYKGFACMYRQTEEGIRSSPGASSFISTDSPPYTATANNYNGTTRYALRGSDLSGNADSKFCTISVWFRVDGGNGTTRIILNSDNNNYQILLNTSNECQIRVRNAAATNLFQASTTTAFPAGPAWHNVIWALNLASLTTLLAVDGLSESQQISTGPITGTIDWTSVDHSLGATPAASLLFDGCLAEIYFNNESTLDIAVPNVLAAFISPSGDPVDLGADGSFPNGTQPICYFLDADASANLGFGGNYVNNAALAACSDAP